MAWYRCGMNGTYRATTVSRSGAICNYVANVGGVPLSRFIANITATQSGSGTPSPTNPRTINGVDSVSVVNTPDNDWDELWSIDSGFKGTVNFNQYVGNYTGNKSTVTSLGNNEYKTTSDGTATYFGFTLRQSASVAFNSIADHIYFFSCNITDISIANLNKIRTGNTISIDLGTTTGKKAGIAKASGTGYLYFIATLTGTSSTSDYFTAKDANLIDLTQMFGSTIANYIYSLEQNTEGAGVAFFRNLYPDNYYAYTAGTTELVGGDDKETATTALPTTCYGGTLNVGTGVLTVIKGIKDMGDISWTYSSDNGVFYSGKNTDIKVNDTDTICSSYLFDGSKNASLLATIASELNNYEMAMFSSEGQQGNIVVKDTNYTDPTAFATAMTGQKIVYTLATPQTYQLTPAQLTQLLGENNVWCDSGDSEVDFFKIIRT